MNILERISNQTFNIAAGLSHIPYHTLCTISYLKSGILNLQKGVQLAYKRKPETLAFKKIIYEGYLSTISTYPIYEGC